MSPAGTADTPGPRSGEAPHDILARINERERQIERLLEEAQEAAAATVAEARRAAADLLEARRAEARRVAAAAGEGALEQARREAAGIREAAAREAAAVLATPRERVDLAAARLLAIVLGEPPAGVGAP